ncbi:MAG: hypothetical protein K6T75_00550 [Acetobacteraceae bacterium]|nr:hypothetical protein [Acetobacteraceae bacterium]
MAFLGRGRKRPAAEKAAGPAEGGGPAKAAGEGPGRAGAKGAGEKKPRETVGSIVKEFVYGMAAHDMTRFALKTRSSMEHLFILITMGDLLGVPILPPYYSLRLLPYVVPQIATWKRRMLREKDLTDALF